MLLSSEFCVTGTSIVLESKKWLSHQICWKKPAGCSISTISLPSALKLILAGVVLRSQELLRVCVKKKKKELFKGLVDEPQGEQKHARVCKERVDTTEIFIESECDDEASSQI